MPATQTATITVKSNSPPEAGKKKNKIVDVSGDFYYAFPDKAAHLTEGGTFDITFTTSRFNGYDIRNIEGGRRSQAAPQAPRAGSAGAAAGSAGSSHQDEHIFVSMMLKEAVRSGRLDALALDDVVELGLRMRQAHKAIWSAAAVSVPTQRSFQPSGDPRDMNDDIPF